MPRMREQVLDARPHMQQGNDVRALLAQRRYGRGIIRHWLDSPVFTNARWNPSAGRSVATP